VEKEGTVSPLPEMMRLLYKKYDSLASILTISTLSQPCKRKRPILWTAYLHIRAKHHCLGVNAQPVSPGPPFIGLDPEETRLYWSIF